MGSVFLIILGSLVVLAIILAIDYAIAKIFCKIADEKGYEGRKFFWWIFLFGIIGYLMVIALPDRGVQRTVADNSAKADIPAPEEIPDI